MNIKLRILLPGPFLIGMVTSCQTLPIPKTTDARWRFVPSKDDSGRLAHSLCGFLKGQFIAFGGIDEARGSPLNSDVLLYDTARHQWQTVSAEAGPSPRNYTAFAAFDHSIYIMGGETAQSPASADAFAYDLHQKKWERLPPADQLLPRRQATLTRVGTRLVVFGGQGPSAVTNWASYDFIRRQWQVSPLPQDMPSRVSHVAVGLDARRMLVWGGFVEQERRGDGLILDVLTQNVTPLPATTRLTPRANARALLVDDRVFIWGGAPADGNANSGAVFDIKSQQWASLPPIPDPQFARLKGAEIAPWDQGFVLFGGRFGTDAFNHQLWFFDTTHRRWNPIRTSDHPPGRVAHCLVAWGPKRLAVWGGIGHAEGAKSLTQFDGLWLLED